MLASTVDLVLNMKPPILDKTTVKVYCLESAQLEHFLPNLLILGVLLEVLHSDGVNDLRANGLGWFHLRMGRRSTTLSVDRLSFLRSRPSGKKPSRVRMRRIFQDSYRDDSRGSFGEHVINRRALLFARRVMMRIACETCRSLAGNQQLGELRMSFVKFNIVCRNPSEDSPGLLQAVMFVG